MKYKKGWKEISTKNKQINKQYCDNVLLQYQERPTASLWVIPFGIIFVYIFTMIAHII